MARKPTLSLPLCLFALALAAGPLAPAAKARRPASEGQFRAVSVCRPPAPGYASCLGEGSAAPGSLTPAALHAAYGLPTEAPSPQTVAVVDAYNDPQLEADLAVFDERYGLPPCTAANGCLREESGAGREAPLPPASGEWSFEISLDVETVHAICTNCRILLVEAPTPSQEALAEAVQRAYEEGAQEISTSFGGHEPAGELEAYNRPGVVITAAAGDNGYLNWEAPGKKEVGYVDYPAASPHVVAVGATRLVVGENGERLEESVWNDSEGASGGGCSKQFAAPYWQLALPNWQAVGCGQMRAVADIAADGDPYTGLQIYDSQPWDGNVLGWVTAGGTSMASPLVAASFALAGGPAAGVYAPAALYANA